ncbi:hypothetical protein J1N35_027962 [Gossypium stocksii]|uniref:CASP C-terminal domain-containing protein n=1 Tax=Gossypium stocksii TaxID=47602 RepID=A0A9D4A087_9ROSI|nr:hypothetical protein J1N35_027962 [Gossypium stocksii]
MKKELQTRPTEKLVEGLRKKVKILQAVGYNSVEAEDWEAATSGEEMSKMESLLLDKNRKKKHELTQMKVKLSEKISLLETDVGKIRELTEKVNEQQKLIQKVIVQKNGKGLFLMIGIFRRVLGMNFLRMINVSAMFRISQDIRQLKEKIRAQTAELEETKTDNVKLYGKIRCPGEKDLESGFTSDVDSKYKKMYEDDINPFAAFSRKVVCFIIYGTNVIGTYVFGSIEDSDETKLKYYFPL